MAISHEDFINYIERYGFSPFSDASITTTTTASIEDEPDSKLIHPTIKGCLKTEKKKKWFPF